jgi:hypothetical protein
MEGAAKDTDEAARQAQKAKSLEAEAQNVGPTGSSPPLSDEIQMLMDMKGTTERPLHLITKAQDSNVSTPAAKAVEAAEAIGHEEDAKLLPTKAAPQGGKSLAPPITEATAALLTPERTTSQRDEKLDAAPAATNDADTEALAFLSPGRTEFNQEAKIDHNGSHDDFHGSDPDDIDGSDDSADPKRGLEDSFMDSIQQGPEHVRKLSGKLRNVSPDDQFIFVCRCPYCVSKGVSRATTLTLSRNKFEQWTKSNVYDPKKQVILDEHGFISYDHPLPTDSDAKGQRQRIRKHIKARNDQFFQWPGCTIGIKDERPSPDREGNPKPAKKPKITVGGPSAPVWPAAPLRVVDTTFTIERTRSLWKEIEMLEERLKTYASLGNRTLVGLVEKALEQKFRQLTDMDIEEGRL